MRKSARSRKAAFRASAGRGSRHPLDGVAPPAGRGRATRRIGVMTNPFRMRSGQLDPIARRDIFGPKRRTAAGAGTGSASETAQQRDRPPCAAPPRTRNASGPTDPGQWIHLTTFPTRRRETLRRRELVAYVTPRDISPPTARRLESQIVV